MQDRYSLALGEAGKLKLRATSLLAEGGEERTFEAVVLFRDAARAEARALLALDSPAPEVRLASAVEQCTCLVDGRDALLAARAWGQVLEAARSVPADAAAALLARLQPRYARLESSFLGALQRSPLLRSYRGSLGLLQGRQLTRYRLELQRLLERFPGTPSLWWARARVEESRGRSLAAWEALVCACRLDPDNSRYEALRLRLLPQVASPREADTALSSAYARLQRSAPEVCLMYALAEMELAHRSPRTRRPRLQRALEAILHGRGQVPAESYLGRYLQAAQLILHEQLQGARPTPELLYLAGLGELVVTSSDRGADPVALLTHEATQSLVQHAA
jgi:hypothetical protein